MLRSFASLRMASPGRVLVALGAALALVLTMTNSPAEAARNFATVCPEPGPTDYEDAGEIPEAHLAAVRCLTELGVVQGLGSDVGELYLPDAEVTRAQMATFVAQMLAEAEVQLPEATDQGFTDVQDGDVHASSIRQLAAAGIVQGVTDDRYAGHLFVSREQMATYLVQAQAHAAGIEAEDLKGGDTPFTDVAAGAVHQPSIEGAYELGITDGVGEERYAPHRDVTRAAMASFVARTLDAVVTRQTVADRDGGALAHTVFTFLSEGGRCFQVAAGEAWEASCDPAPGEEPLQLYTLPVDDAFSVVAGVVTTDVTRVVIETPDGDTVEVDELVETRSENLLAWSSPRLLADVEAVVAYEGDTEVARISPDDPASPPFPADTEPDTATGSGEEVQVTDVRVAHHQTYDRVVFDLSGDGRPAWTVQYVEQATAQGSNEDIALEGDATLQVLFEDNVVYPPGDDRLETGTRITGVDTVNEVYFGTIFEGVTQAFVGLDGEEPFRAFWLEDPSRVVVDVAHASTAD